jgi:predicted nucleic acid-binding protein
LKEAMNEVIIFDTSVLIDNQRTARHSQRMVDCAGVIRNSSVVLAELWRGATALAERQFVKTIEESRPTLTPTANIWLDSGRLLAKMRAGKGFEPHELRNLHFDVPIALTARAHGALLITSNRDDFELIREYRDFRLEVW